MYSIGFKHVVVSSSGSPSAVGATLMKTGQTTSYRTGDDGDIEAGRLTSFTVLASNNPFGNTNRFTDELGGQTYTNNIVIDWSTYDAATAIVLGYYRTQNGSSVTWDAAIDGASALSIGAFTSGWRLPNIKEHLNLYNWSGPNGNVLNYSPFNIGGIDLWTSTTVFYLTDRAYSYNGPSQYLTIKSGASARFIACRTFTVTGTTLS